MSTDPSHAAARTCYRHPDRRGGVSCQRCDRPICPECMRQASVGFHCPECAKAGQQKVYTRANMSVLNRPALTQALIGVNAAIFALGVLLDPAALLGGGEGDLTRLGGLLGDSLRFGDVGVVEGVAGGEWYRVVTSGFLHANIIHLGLNMFLLFQLGSILEPAFGRARFGAVYATSLLTGSFGVLLLSPRSITVGASGAVFGLMGALLLAQRAKGIDPWTSGIASTLMINLLFTFSIRGISIGGHIGGLAGGLVAAWILLEGAKTLGTQRALAASVGFGLAAALVGILLVSS